MPFSAASAPLREKCAWVNQYEANILQKEFEGGLVSESNLSKRENGGCQDCKTRLNRAESWRIVLSNTRLSIQHEFSNSV